MPITQFSVTRPQYTPDGNVALLTPNIARAISKACRFVSKDDLRPNLQYVCFHFKYDTLTIVATDAYWAYVSEPFNLGELKTFADYKYLVSITEARAIVSAITRNKTLYLQTGTIKHKGFRGKPEIPALYISKGDYEIFICNNGDKSYPEYEKLIPSADKDIKATLTVPVGKLRSALIDCMGKYEYGGNKYQWVQKRWEYPVFLHCFPDVLHVCIDEGKKNLYDREIKPVDYNYSQLKSKAYNAKRLVFILKQTGAKENIFIGDIEPDNAYSAAIIAQEGAQEKFILMPIDFGTNIQS